MKILNLSDNEKKRLLKDKKFIEQSNLNEYEIKEIINSLSDISKAEILLDENLIKETLKLSKFKITELAKTLSNDETKNQIIKIYKIESFSKLEIISTFTVQNKCKLILEDNEYTKYEIIQLLNSLKIEELNEFLNLNRGFLIKKNIKIHDITRIANVDKQKEFVENIDRLNILLVEKRRILATLRKEVKANIDITNFPKEYITAINMKTNNHCTRIMWEKEKSPEEYRGLDSLLRINPEKFSKEDKEKFLRLCDICPNLLVINSLGNENERESEIEFYSTPEEYRKTEKWIESILNKIKPEYTKLQKIAIIDNAIGKKISYSPDFGTEKFVNNNARALWKIANSGYGVCNGIAKLEKYILEKAGIECEIVSCKVHSFLKINNIEILHEDGSIEKGNTILDPTWNLASHKFNGFPSNFVINYEKARKSDVDSNGMDHKCHQNDEKLSNVTLLLDNKELRKLFTSVGLANKDGKFKVKQVIEQSKLINETYSNNPNENINKQLELLQNTYPEFAISINETTSILKEVFLNKKNLMLKKCVINRVFDKKDKFKKTILYIYIDSDELGEKFYYADKNQKKFIELNQKEFEEKFECYEKDLNKNKGIKPWKKEEKSENLATNSGKILAEEEKEK